MSVEVVSDVSALRATEVEDRDGRGVLHVGHSGRAMKIQEVTLRAPWYILRPPYVGLAPSSCIKFHTLAEPVAEMPPLGNPRVWIRYSVGAVIVSTGLVAASIGGVPGAIIGVLVSTCGAGFLRPVQDDIRRFVEKLESTECRIVLYGLGGTGKTELRRRFLRKGEFVFDGPATATPDIEWADIPVGDDPATKVRVRIFDYSGQQSSQVAGDGSGRFFGPPGDRRVHAVFFVIDHFRPISGSDGKQLSDEELLRRCTATGSQLVEERVQRNRRYLDEDHLQAVFDRSVNPENKTPRAVRVLINKKELIEAYLITEVPSSMTARDFALASYADVIDQIRTACDKYDILDFEVELISARDDDGTKSIMDAFLKRHFGRVS